MKQSVRERVHSRNCAELLIPSSVAVASSRRFVLNINASTAGGSRRYVLLRIGRAMWNPMPAPLRIAISQNAAQSVGTRRPTRTVAAGSSKQLLLGPGRRLENFRDGR